MSNQTNPSEPNHSHQCPNCSAPIPADAPDGLCPKCLAEQGARDRTAARASHDSLTPPTPGELDDILDDYVVTELIGQGGMGAVYRACQKSLDRNVAIKVLPAEFTGDSAFVERFSREANALAQLNHPNIVTVHDAGRAGDYCFIVMEFVEGANLRQLLEAGKLSPGEALSIVSQLCAGLQYAHDHRIVHRDIKPENILVTEEGIVKISDFGLVKMIGHPDFQVSLTATNQTMGTLRYMAPEQLSGTSEADHRADIYSLGVVFYELLTGRVPGGRFDPPSEKVSVDVRLDDVVLRALQDEPERRYQQAVEMKTEMAEIGSGTPPSPDSHAPATYPARTGTIRRLAHSSTFWTGLFALVGLATVTLPRSSILGGLGISLGFESGWRPITVAGISAVLFVVNLLSSRHQPLPAWRGPAFLATGVVVMLLGGWYILEVGHVSDLGAAMRTPNLDLDAVDAADLSTTVGRELGALITQSARPSVGPMLTVVLGFLVLVIGVLELVGARRTRAGSPLS